MNDAELKNADLKIKQQVIEQIKSVNNILVTVSRDPSVDDLTALIGLTAFLNKIGKHATAIFSGAIPAAINFLEPETVIENTADSLRDFIIALDKEKADHLRYKIEGDMVKIFITPYRTTISSSDLEFSQGDLNVELVLALGVENKEHLDAVLATQGDLIHDVTIATLSDGTRKSELGNIDWNDKNASCLSEMVVTVSDAFKTDKPILDKQISTALLTGIVAATNRFSNIRTTSRVMTIAAQLMAAGADQQLIAAKLDEAHEIQSLASTNDGAIEPNTLDNSSELKIDQVSTLPPTPKDSLVIDHNEEITSAETPETEAPLSTLSPIEEPTMSEPEFIQTPIQPLQTEVVQPEPELPQPEVAAPVNEVTTSTLSPEDTIQQAMDNMPKITKFEPSLGGSLSATTEQAAEDARRELEKDQNKTILSHSYLDGNGSEESAPINSTSQAAAEEKPVDIFNETPAEQSTVAPQTFEGMPIVGPAKMEGLPMPPPLPDFSTLPPAPTPDFGIPVPPLTMPPVQNTIQSQPISTLPPQPSEVDNDPSKFRIPGQY